MIIGVIMGRFQIFHNGHLRYLREAYKRCDYLIIGITNPDPRNVGNTIEAQHRQQIASNPLTYYERMMMIKAVCKEEKMLPEFFDIVPIPLDYPENIKYYIPDESVVMTTIHDNWSLEKKRRIEMQGYKVEILINEYNKKKLSSSFIRKLIVNDDEYSQYVPKSVYKYINDKHLSKKIKKYCSEDN